MLYVQSISFVIISFPSLAFFANSAFADDRIFNPTISEKWHFELGAFSQDADLKVSAGPAGEVPDVIDLNSLGADEDDEAIWLAGRWRINERWHVGLSFIEVDRDGFASSSEDFTFGEPPDQVDVTIGASVTSNFNTKYYILQGGYSFVRSDRANFGVGVGLHVMRLSASISAELSANGMTTDLGTGASDSTAPLPNVYFFGDYAFTPKLAATASIGWFGLEVDKYDGELVSLSASLEYRPWDNFGIGLGYSLVNIDVSIDETDSLIEFEIDASGPRLYFAAGFGSVR